MTNPFKIPTPEALTKAVGAMQAAVAAMAGAHGGQLDRVVTLSTEGGPVGLGFLDLTLELAGPSNLLEQVKAAAQVSWVFTATGLVVRVHADVSPGGPGAWHQRAWLETVIRPDALEPGLVAFVARSSEQYLKVKTRKDRVRLRLVPLVLRLRIMEQARPIGSIPGAHNGQWLPFQA